MPLFTRKFKTHSRNSSVSSSSSCPVERCSTPQPTAYSLQPKSVPVSPDPHASFLAKLQEEENRWQDVTDVEKDHLVGQRLTKTLRCLVADKCALGYLTAFLESRNAAGYLHFWMEAEAIRRRLETDDRPSLGKSPPPAGGGDSPAVDSRPEHPPDHLPDHLPAHLTNHLPAHPTDHPLDHPPEPPLDLPPEHPPDHPPDQPPEHPPDHQRDLPCEAPPAHGRNGEWPTAAALVRLLRKYALGEGGAQQLCLPTPLRAEVQRAAAADAVSLGARVQVVADAAITDGHLAEFLQSDHYQCYQVDVLTSSSVEICDILFNETVVFMFMEFMEQEGLSHYIEFWMSSNNFRDQLYAMGADCDGEQTQADAMILYDKYFSLQAACPLGFGDRTRTELELNICCDGGPDPECFLRPMLVLHNVLQQRYLHVFLNSQVFFKYAMDLVNTIRHPAKPCLFDRTDAASTCSSDLGSSVTGGSVPERWSHSDPGQLHRRRYYGLSIGHVNHVGRYESHLEPQPDPQRSSALRRAFRSILRHDEHKVKEEMAWRVANLIVKDVTNVTLGLGGSPTHRPHC